MNEEIKDTEKLMPKEQVIEGLRKLRGGKNMEVFEIINTAIIYLENPNLSSAPANVPAPESIASRTPD